jgi:PAS domain S-box-containing protein
MSRLLQPESELLDRLHDAAICCDLHGNITYCNLGAERVYEYPRAELVGSNVARLYPESELPKLKPLIDEVMETGKADRKLLNVTKNGRELYIHLSVSLLSDADGVPLGMIGFSIDLTELERAERAVRQVEARNRAARQAVGVGTWQWNVTTGVVWWDAVSGTLLDTEHEEQQSYAAFLGRVHPDDRRRLDAILKDCVARRVPYSGEYRVIHRDGSVHWLSGRGRLYEADGDQPLRMLGTATDITPHKIAEEKLRASEAKYRVLYESPIIGVALGDLDSFTEVNDTFCRIVGYSREELTSGLFRWQDITPAEHLASDFAALQQMAESGSCTPFEKEYIRKDGVRVRIILGAALVSREPFSWTCFILDVTSQHRALTALRATEQLTAAAKMGSLLAHEINNPLAALTNVIYLLRYGPRTLTREDLLTAAEESLTRVTRITRQMVGIYGSTEQVSDIKVMDVLEDTLAGYSAQIRAKQLLLEKRNELGEGAFRGVEPELRRLLSALVENAVEHAPPRGKVRVHIFRGREWAEPVREGLRIVVSDNGAGIPRDSMERMFEPFFSVQKTPAKGLGMWAGKSIVEKSKGKIKVRSNTRPGKSGTCVSVFLPEPTLVASAVL